VSELAPELALEFERIDEEGYMLIWPEFRNPSSVSNSAARLELAQFWGFLLEWGNHQGFTVPPISEAYREFLGRSSAEQFSLLFPAGFPPLPDEGGDETLGEE
jgi:hypothetical protein